MELKTTKINILKRENLEEYIRQARNAIVFVHKNPDADCIGSAIALKRLIHSLNSKCEVTLFGKPANKYQFLKGINEIKYDIRYNVFDLIFTVDTSELKDLEDPKFFKGCCERSLKVNPGSKIVIIDHHLKTSEGFEKLEQEFYLLQDSSKKSNCEIILDLLYLFCPGKITKELSELLITCIYSETSKLIDANSESFRAIAFLMDIGNIHFNQIASEYESTPFGYERFYGILLKDWTEITKRGLIIFEVPMPLLREHFPKYFNVEVFRKEGYLTYLFDKYRRIKLGSKFPYKSPKGVLGIYPNKWHPDKRDKFLIFETNKVLDDEQIKKLTELGFKLYRENQTRFMRPLEFDDVLNGKYSNLIANLDIL